MTGHSAPPRGPVPVDLAHHRPFRLGKAEVRPASRDMVDGDRREVLEPRVMQVLVVLASAKGATLSRDDLIDACWGGRAISDDAISRVISKLRALGKSLGGYEVETIPKIGYRLIAERPVTQPMESRPRLNRRALVAGTAAAVIVGSGAVMLRQPWRHRPDPEAKSLYARGTLLSREGSPDQDAQVIAYFERAVAVDPLYSDAWGALALSYTHALQGLDSRETGRIAGRIRSAARRTLELDSDNVDAQIAQIFITPHFRSWSVKEASLRNMIALHPDHWLAHSRLAVLMNEVGRQEEGIRLHRRALEIEPLLPFAYTSLIIHLSALGRVQEAEAIIEEAGRRWPRHPMLWLATFDHHIGTGQYEEASALVANSSRHPYGFGPPQLGIRANLVRALRTRSPVAISASVARLAEIATAQIWGIEMAAPNLALLNATDAAFAGLERYYFNQGPFGRNAPRGPYDERRTAFLFRRSMAGARRDPRFAVLLSRIGLEDYWRDSGTRPDFRRG